MLAGNAVVDRPCSSRRCWRPVGSALAACGSEDSEPAARTTVTAPVASVAKTSVTVADTKRGAVGYRSVGSGPPLVLVMGFGSSMEDWDPTFVDDLARTRRVVVFDNAGIGKSTALASKKLTISGMADQTSALIDALGLGTPDVLGWSMGGMVAQALAVRHPDQVRRLVLSATQPGTGKAKKDPRAGGQGASERHAFLFQPDTKYASRVERFLAQTS